MSQNNNQETPFKTLGTVSLAVIIFALLYNSLLGGSRGFGFQMNYGMGHGMGYGYGVGGFGDINGIFASLLVLAVNLLWLVFVGALLAGVVIFIKNYLDENKVDLSGYRAALKETCAGCGRELLPGWNCCPSCGLETRAKGGCEAQDVQEVQVNQQEQAAQQLQEGKRMQDESQYRPTGTRLSHEEDLT